MRRGTIYRRCTKCGRKVPRKTCPGCGYDRFSWAYVVDTGHVGAKRRQQAKSGFATKAEANAALTDVQAAVARGIHVEPSKLTVADFLTNEWLPAIDATIRPTTFRSYQLHVDLHINPRLGTHRLQQLTGASLNAFYSTLLTEGRLIGPGGLAPATVRRIHATAHRAFRDAVRWGRLTRNPADQADPPKTTATGAMEMKTWSASELRSFLDAIRDHRLYPAFVVAASTGVRRGELLGLQWDDVDLGAATLSIRRALVAVGYQAQLGEPKTRRARRQLALDAHTIAVLRQHRVNQAQERLAWGPAWTNNGHVFTREDGSLIHPDGFTKLFGRLVRGSGMPRIRLHDLRHGHATLALEAGVHPKVVSERLGHASIGITLDTYSHAIPAMQEEAAERIAALIFSN